MTDPATVSDTRARVLLLVTELKMGGAARVVGDMAEMLGPRFVVHEAVFNRQDGIDFPGSAPLSLDVAGGGGPIAKLRNLARRIRRVRELKRSLSIDVSISHLEGAHWVDVLSGGTAKTIACVHGSILGNQDIRGLSGWLRRRVLAPLVYNRADHVVTVSRDIVPELLSLGVRPTRISTINNAFDLQGIEERSRKSLSAAEAALFAHGPVLVTTGRLAAQKNQGPLLEILARLKQRRPARLLILGDGPLRDQLLGKAEALGLRSWNTWSGEPLAAGHDVYFVGVQDNPFRWLNRADLFVLPSGWEGFPLALCEAMICGAPVVATDCLTGPREILAPETDPPSKPIRAPERGAFGWLMPVLHDPATRTEAVDAWVGKLAELLEDASERRDLVEAGRKRMADFSREKIASQWFALIDDLLGTSPR